jgi:hypothetical protein
MLGPCTPSLRAKRSARRPVYQPETHQAHAQSANADARVGRTSCRFCARQNRKHNCRWSLKPRGRSIIYAGHANSIGCGCSQLHQQSNVGHRLPQLQYSIKVYVFNMCRVASVREAYVQVMEEKDYGQLPKLNIDTTICSNLCSLLPLFLK